MGCAALGSRNYLSLRIDMCYTTLVFRVITFPKELKWLAPMGSRLMCFHPQTDRPNTQKGKAKAKVNITIFSHTHVARGACEKTRLCFRFYFWHCSGLP